ncbi:unnamed protein product [Chrysodeixis includens]|uniref:Uncharacterized protein n=1 Tax=Chrysodeixis includens TaxID=689277 RepID=A0A9P0BW99_CHRIL|nr:unnamed protein product [Chrysodeixis includens]
MDYREIMQNQADDDQDSMSHMQYINDPNEEPGSTLHPQGEVLHVTVRPTYSGLLSIDVSGSQANDVVPQPCSITSGPISPVSSNSSVAGEARQWPTREQQMESSDEEYARIIRKSELLGVPYEAVARRHPSDEDPVDSFVHFVRSLLRSFQDEELKLKVMDDISQSVINAKSEEIKRIKK